ncbi:MAG: RNA polymerase sigma factor [Deltaproteobacteria bacterium]|nr:RNA polymerase sigma factor [Deltaproteobacteria bacterium]MBK8714239.1 RNA polymerase sigma factor [Deltaproteobacteria bacterium]MBP7285971.1 RNA polymerase sigma factor [Nannocystaceae bacterium]
MSQGDDDATLRQRWNAGDERAGRALFRRHAPGVLRFFRSKLPGSAEDLTQEVFARFLRDRRDDVMVRPFLFGIARNVLREELRRRRGPGDAPMTSIADLGAVGSTRLHQRQRLLRALQVLPVDQQIAIELHYWEGFTSDELGATLGISASAARSRLELARERLRASLCKAFPKRPAHAFDDLEAWSREIAEAIAGRVDVDP